MSSKQDTLEPEAESATDHEAAIEAEAAAQDETGVDDGESKASEDETPIEEELQQAQATVQEYWDQIMRLRAEIENNRKRAERDIEAAHKFALKNFTENL